MFCTSTQQFLKPTDTFTHIRLTSCCAINWITIGRHLLFCVLMLLVLFYVINRVFCWTYWTTVWHLSALFAPVEEWKKAVRSKTGIFYLYFFFHIWMNCGLIELQPRFNQKLYRIGIFSSHSIEKVNGRIFLEMKQSYTKLFTQKKHHKCTDCTIAQRVYTLSNKSISNSCIYDRRTHSHDCMLLSISLLFH